MAKNKIYLLIALLIGIFLRIFLPAFINERGDILVHYDWSRTLYKINLKNSYFYPTWTYSPLTQPPLMNLNFWFSRHIYENRYLLSEMHNTIKLPPSSLILWFDRHGEAVSLRFWAILGDVLCSFLAFFFVKKMTKKWKLAFWAFLLFFFNPISLFETIVWGQNDIYGASLVFLSIYFLFFKKTKIFSPLIFLLGIFTKPTALILGPFYAVIYFCNLNYAGIKNILISFFKTLISVGLCLLAFYYLFLPFIDKSNFLQNAYFVIDKRISNSSKGVSLASISAFNLFSTFFNIDKTSGNSKILGLSLDTYSYLFIIIINTFVASNFIRNFKKTKDKFYLTISSLFLVSQGSFLFMTNMLERYFILAFLPAVILTVSHFKKLGKRLIFVQFIWFINLIYAFYLRDIFVLKNFFWGNNYFFTRVLSLTGILIFISLSISILKHNQKSLINGSK